MSVGGMVKESRPKKGQYMNTNGKGYCVFWFPGIYHTDINERLQRFEVEKNISDFGPDAAKLVVSIDYPHDSKDLKKAIEKARNDKSLIEKCLRFEVYKTTQEGEREYIFKGFNLTHVDHSNNGLVVYSYDKPQDYPSRKGIPPFEKALTTIFYHCAKSLFHNHEVQTDRDSGLVAYVPDLGKFDPNKSIHDKDNEAIKFFFEQYENIFKDYAERASGYIAKRDAILAKFEGKIGPSEEDFNLSGYKSLIQYGKNDFKQWYGYGDHPDVKRCEKEVQSWHLIINPPYKKKKKREYYIDRHNDIAKVLTRILKANPRDEIVKEYGIVERYKAVGEKLREWGEVSWHSLTKKDLFPVDYMLTICEIGLEIKRFPKRHRVLYRKLEKCYLDLPLLTEQARRKIGMLCEGALTEYVYCKTLFESKYNTQVTHTKPTSDNADCDKWRKKACNIRNAIRYIETVKFRCANAQTNGVNMILKKADKLSQRASVWTIVGIILSAIGMALTIVGIVLTIKSSC